MMQTPGNPADLAKAQKFDSEKNDAEILLEIQRASGRPLNKLNPATYPIKSITIKSEPEPLVDSYLNFFKGMQVSVKINNPFAEEHAFGTIDGFTPDGRFVVINGRQYSTNLQISFSH